MSGDKWFIRQMAFTKDRISAPYCWRPLVPTLARWFGFRPITYLATVTTPLLIYFYAGAGWAGCAVALMFIGNKHLFSFHIRSPEYAEGVGQWLVIASLWSLSTGSVLIWPLLLLSALCRETLIAMLATLVVLNGEPVLLLPILTGAIVAYTMRRETKDNKHPLVEKTAYGTVLRWAKEKQGDVLDYAHTIQPLRGLVFAVPFVWGDVSSFARVGLSGFVAIWLAAIPATGQCRIMSYGFVLLIPFAAALPGPWLWLFVILAWFWPGEWQKFSEAGDVKFGFIR